MPARRRAGRSGSPGEDADPAAGQREVPLAADAEDLPLVCRCRRTAFGKQLTARAAVTVPGLYAVLSAVNTGGGFSLLPRSLCREYPGS